MGFNWSEAPDFQPGMIYLGRHNTGQDKGIFTERHAITIAGAGSGKGAALIIPNMLRWVSAAFLIDPKGECAELTYQARLDMGQLVGMLDPFHRADVPPELRVSINVLESINPDSLTAGADVQAVADGLVKRSNSQNAEFDDAAVSVLAGIIAYVLLTAPPEHRNLSAMRSVLLQPNGQPNRDDEEPSGLYADALRMSALTGCGGLTRAASSIIMNAIESSKGLEKEALATARRQSAWLDDPAFNAVLNSSTFDLTALRTGKATLYVVIPPEYLDTQGAFLRLFVRTALNVMMKGGNRKNAPCLFILDEFYSLGQLQIVATAAGQMRSYGVQLWPFLQDLGQLTSRYGSEAAGTFFGNSDAHIFFGNTDAPSLEYVSARLGSVTAQDVGMMPPAAPVETFDPFNMQPDLRANAKNRANYQTQQSMYQHAMTEVGRPRLSPQDIRLLVGKNHGATAFSMIVFGKAGDVFNLALSPYFRPWEPPAEVIDNEGILRRQRLLSAVVVYLTTGFALGLLHIILIAVANHRKPFSILVEPLHVLLVHTLCILLIGYAINCLREYFHKIHTYDKTGFKSAYFLKANAMIFPIIVSDATWMVSDILLKSRLALPTGICAGIICLWMNWREAVKWAENAFSRNDTEEESSKNH